MKIAQRFTHLMGLPIPHDWLSIKAYFCVLFVHNMTQMGMQKLFIVFTYEFCIHLMYFLRVTTTCTVTYRHNQYWTTLSKTGILLTRDDVGNSVRQRRKEHDPKTYFVDTDQGANSLKHFAKEFNNFFSIAQALTATNGISMKKICWNSSRRFTAICQKKAFTRYLKIQAECFTAMEQHFF